MLVIRYEYFNNQRFHCLHQCFFLRIGVSPFTVTLARSQVVSFSQPILQADHRLFIKNPLGNFNFQAYNEPLHNLAWVFVDYFVSSHLHFSTWQLSTYNIQTFLIFIL